MLPALIDVTSNIPRALGFASERRGSIMLTMRAGLIDRYRRRVERMEETGIDMAALPDELVATLDEAIGFDGLCSVTLDPSTLIPTDVGLFGHRGAGVRFPDALAVTLSAPVHATTRALAQAPHPVEILSHAYDGDRERSRLYRDVLAPQGFEHSMRAMFVCDGACWGCLNFLRGAHRPDFTPDDAEVADAIAPELARAVRRSILAGGERGVPDSDEPGVILLDHTRAVMSTNRAAQRWLGDLHERRDAVPPVVHAVAVVALHGRDESAGAPPPRVRLRTRSGVWLHVHATRLEGAGGLTAAIVIERARPDQLSPVIAHAYGLTPREREVAGLVVDGCNTAEIARRLYIAAYTVQDHLKAVFDKFGVRNRRDLASALSSQTTPPRGVAA